MAQNDSLPVWMVWGVTINNKIYKIGKTVSRHVFEKKRKLSFNVLRKNERSTNIHQKTFKMLKLHL